MGQIQFTPSFWVNTQHGIHKLNQMEEVGHNVAKSAFFWRVLCKPDQAISFKISTKSLSKEKLIFLKGCFSEYDFELAYKKIATKIDPSLQKKQLPLDLPRSHSFGK